jgi:chemotaxis protein MotB
MLRPRPERKRQGHERWLLTYADLITLLMIFFVVMYALSRVDSAKFQALSGALGGVFGSAGQPLGEGRGGGIPTMVPALGPGSLQGVLVELNAYLENQQLSGSAQYSQEEGSVTINLGAKGFFGEGEAALKDSAEANLDALATVLKAGTFRIRVEAHTNKGDAPASHYPSDWQLTAARAANVVQYLVGVAGVPPQRIMAAGLGDTRPVSDAATEQGRARNRRLSIVLTPQPGE